MKYIYITLISIFVVILVILYNFATTATNYGITAATSTDQQLNIVLELVNMIISLFSIIIITGTVQKFQESSFGHILLYFTFGTFLLTVIRLFLTLHEVQILLVSDETITMGWHLIFYCATICFLGGMQKLYRFAKEKTVPVSQGAAHIVGLVFTALGITVLASAHTFDSFYTKTLKNNLLYDLGLHHFLAFLFAGVIALYLWKAKKLSPNFKLIINAFLWAFVFLSLVHVWELLTESWKMIPVTTEFGELAEQVITIPGYLFIAIAYLQKLPAEAQKQKQLS